MTNTNSTAPANAVLVRDESTLNPHLAQRVGDEYKALCNRRYRVWVDGTIASDAEGENVWGYAACPRCLAKADKAATA